jgi:AraC family transcriptional regulator
MLYNRVRNRLLVEIAVAAEDARMARPSDAGPGRIEARLLARGSGWTVADVVCSCGPNDRPYDEQHERVSIAIVTSGTFQYRGSGSNGREVMTPGSILLGSAGQAFECGHEHGTGDRCLAFRFTPDYFETIAEGSRVSDVRRVFRSLRLPPVPALSPVVADACAAMARSSEVAWEEVGIRLAERAIRADRELEPDWSAVTPAAIARVTRVVRMIEERRGDSLTIASLAREAGLSPFHFLRTFEKLTGVTPHQYLRRARLRTAAALLMDGSAKILDVALDAGFGDVSNFNHAFRAEFGVSPRVYRRRADLLGPPLKCRA